MFAVRRGDGVVGGYLGPEFSELGGVVRGRVTRVSNFGFRALEESIGGVRGALFGSTF